MEYELLELCVMALADSLRRWMMHRVSSFIKTKWYNQNTPTRDTHLDKVITPCCFSLKLIFFPLSLLSCTSPLTSWLLANTMIWFSMLTLLTRGEDLDIVFFYQTEFFKIVFMETKCAHGVWFASIYLWMVMSQMKKEIAVPNWSLLSAKVASKSFTCYKLFWI